MKQNQRRACLKVWYWYYQNCPELWTVRGVDETLNVTYKTSFIMLFDNFLKQTVRKNEGKWS